MRRYTFILYILIGLQSVTVNSAAKYSYGRSTYGDRALREFEDPETFDTEYGNGERRFRKYHSNYRYRPSRSGRERHSGHSVDLDRERAYYNGPGRENDPSIEVIVDPSKKKAVAVIENGPAGQSRYELTGYEMANEPAMQQQSANLDNAAGKTERKRSQKMLDSNANYENNETGDSEKQKRNAELTKRKINKASKMANVPFKQDYTDDQVGRLPTKRKSETAENCPPHLEEQAKDQKRNEEGIQQQKEKNSVKREVASAFSESQLNSLSDSLARVKDSGEDVEELKRVLYDMGLVQNSKRDVQRSVDESVETKRDQRQAEDEDLSKDNIVMKRESEAGDEEAWDDDENEEEFDEQMDKRDAESDNWEDTEEDEAMADEPMDKMKYGTGELAEAKMNDDNVKETSEMRDKRQNKENVDTREENAEENQNEMIDNYAKELQQTNLEAAARSKREQDKSKMKQSKDNAKRSDKDEDKLIKEAESQVTPDSNAADDKKKLTKRENAKDGKEAKEKRQESDETKKKMESEIKEKIQMIKEKVKREILEENAENSRDSYANFPRAVRAADSLDLDGAFKRSKRDLSGSIKEAENLNQHDLKQNGNGTRVAIDYKYNQTNLSLNDSKGLDPIVESHDLKPIVRQHRAVNATGLVKIDGTSKDIEPKENHEPSDDCKAKAMPPAVRKRREIATDAKEMEKEGVTRQKRANGDPEKQMVYEPFQNGEVDETEEEGEFGDNYKDNRLYIDKRQARNEEEYFEEPQQQNGEHEYEERDGSYFDGENNAARRRRSFEDADNARIENGAGLRIDDRAKREPVNGNAKLTDEEEYSENLYFGPLSKTYNEDLVRYKRVKRDKP